MQPPTRGRTTGRTYWYIVSILSCQNISNSTGYLTDKELKDAPSPSAFNTNVPPLDNYTTGSPCVRNRKHFLAGLAQDQNSFCLLSFYFVFDATPFRFSSFSFPLQHSVSLYSIALHRFLFHSNSFHFILFYLFYFSIVLFISISTFSPSTVIFLSYHLFFLSLNNVITGFRRDCYAQRLRKGPSDVTITTGCEKKISVKSLK